MLTGIPHLQAAVASTSTKAAVAEVTKNTSKVEAHAGLRALPAQGPPEPALELARLRALDVLRAHLDAACRAASRPVQSPPPAYAFERWHARTLHEQQTLAAHNAAHNTAHNSAHGSESARTGGDAQVSTGGDVLVPTHLWTDKGLVADLERVGVAAAAAATIAERLAAVSAAACKLLPAPTNGEGSVLRCCDS